MLNKKDIREIASKVLEMDDVRYGRPSPTMPDEQMRHLHETTERAVSDTLAAMEALGYACVRTRVGMFIGMGEGPQ